MGFWENLKSKYQSSSSSSSGSSGSGSSGGRVTTTRDQYGNIIITSGQTYTPSQKRTIAAYQAGQSFSGTAGTAVSQTTPEGVTTKKVLQSRDIAKVTTSAPNPVATEVYTGISRAETFSPAAQKKFNIKENVLGTLTGSAAGTDISISAGGHRVTAPIGTTNIDAYLVPSGRTKLVTPQTRYDLFSKEAQVKFNLIPDTKNITGTIEGRRFSGGGGGFVAAPLGSGATLKPGLTYAAYSPTPSRDKASFSITDITGHKWSMPYGQVLAGVRPFTVAPARSITKTSGEGFALETGRGAMFSGGLSGGYVPTVSSYEFESFRLSPTQETYKRYVTAQQTLRSPEFSMSAGIVGISLLPGAFRTGLSIVATGAKGVELVKKPTIKTATEFTILAGLSVAPFLGKLAKAKVSSKSSEVITTTKGTGGVLTSTTKAVYNIKVGRKSFRLEGTGLEIAAPIKGSKAAFGLDGRYLYSAGKGVYGLQNVGGFRYSLPSGGSKTSVTYTTALFKGTKRGSMRVSPETYVYNLKRKGLVDFRLRNVIRDIYGDPDFYTYGQTVRFGKNPLVKPQLIEVALLKNARRVPVYTGKPGRPRLKMDVIFHTPDSRSQTLSHELIHFRQMKSLPGRVLNYLEHKALPYKYRGHEIAAFKLEKSYAKKGFKISVVKPKTFYKESGFMRIGQQPFISAPADLGTGNLRTYSVVGIASGAGKKTGLAGLFSKGGKYVSVSRGYLKERFAIDKTTIGTARMSEVKLIPSKKGTNIGGYVIPPKSPMTGTNIFRWYGLPDQGSVLVDSKGPVAVGNMVSLMNFKGGTALKGSDLSPSIAAMFDKGALTTAKVLYSKQFYSTIGTTTGTLAGAQLLGTGAATKKQTQKRSKVYSIPKQRPAIKLFASPKSRAGTIAIPKQSPIIVFKDRTTSIPIQKTASRQGIISPGRQAPAAPIATQPGKTIPIPVGKVPPPAIILPPVSSYDRREKRGRRPVGTFFQPFRYTANVRAGEFSIRGKQPKILTGVSLRPIRKKRKR